MQIQVINKHSDFKIVEDYAGGAVPKSLVFETDGCTKYEASIENGRMKATSEEGKYVIVFEKPEFHVGRLKVTRFYSEDDADMPDGKYDWQSTQQLNIYIGNGSSDAPDEEVIDAYTPIFRGEGSSVTVDNAMDITSKNPVENAVITKALQDVGELVEQVDQRVDDVSEKVLHVENSIPEVPTQVSAFENDADYAPTSYVDMKVRDVELSGSAPADYYDIKFMLNAVMKKQGKYAMVYDVDKDAYMSFSDGNISLNGDEENIIVSGYPNGFSFESNRTLKTVIFRNTDFGTIKSLKTVFRFCQSLKSVNFDVTNTTSLIDMSHMFTSSTSLEEFTAKGIDTSNVTLMNSMFENCSSLMTLDLSWMDTGSVSSMKAMFSNCKSLEYLDISSFNTENVTDMSEMFHSLKLINVLNVSHFITKNVKNFSYMFFEMSSLSNLDLSNFDTSSATNMSNMFRDCKNLENLTLSAKFVTSSVTDMSLMFSNISSMTELDLSNFDTSNVTNMQSMFHSFTTLEVLDVSSFDMTNVTKVLYMFESANKLRSIIGSHTLQEVESGSVTALRGLKVSLKIYSSALERASILALFKGLADLTGGTSQTITLHAIAKARLTAEDIKIATDKNWSVI